MSRTYTVYAIGNAIMDMQLQLSEESFSKLGLTKGQMQLVGVDDQKALIERFHGLSLNQASGGSAANSVIAMAQLGSRVCYGCCLGKDYFGQSYSREMTDLGVVLDSAEVDGEPTGTCVVLITPDAERTMNTHLGASACYSDVHVSGEHLAQAEWLYVEGYLLASDNGRAAVKRAIQLAKAAGVKIAVTFSDVFIVNVFRDALEEVVEVCDLVFANLSEARAFTGESNEESVLAAMEEKCGFAVVTLSDKGAWVLCDGERYFAEPFSTHAIDDTGAGDMFAGGFLHAWTSGFGPRDAGRFAGFLASKVVAQLGPRLLCDVKELLRETTFLPAGH
ncbi:MAG: adenosine kinase [bacterium]|nr:adenosine kinase [bacterium]